MKATTPCQLGIIDIASCPHFKQLSFNSFRDGLPGSWMPRICPSDNVQLTEFWYVFKVGYSLIWETELRLSPLFG